MLCGVAKGYAQWDARKMHFTIDWQVNAPYSTDFADKISGWGMNFEATYNVAPRWAIGGFINFHTNHRYVGRQTLQLSPTESLTTDQHYTTSYCKTSEYHCFHNLILLYYLLVLK